MPRIAHISRVTRGPTSAVRGARFGTRGGDTGSAPEGPFSTRRAAPDGRRRQPRFDKSLGINYNYPVTIDSPLPPHLARLIRDQLATGHFRSEDEVIHTALHLLEEKARSPKRPAPGSSRNWTRG
ncbi:ribbon-helix-helix domain-containing protein [Gemmata massiliana]|uniref:ribbon-helix-helix domain-containing protein n=1 Tax=Gemmata massiliana TaxID=1210884 RepID=UPI0036F2A9DE